MKINKKHIPYIIAAVLLIIFAVIVIRSCDITENYSKAQGKHEALQEVTAQEKKEMQPANKADTEAIAARDKEIAGLKLQIAKTKKQLQQKDDTLTALANARKEAKTDPEIIKVLEKEVETWKAKFNLACAQIEDKDKQIEALSLNVVNWQNIAERYKNAFENADRQARACEEARSHLAKKLKLNRLVSNGKTVAIVAIAGYIAYNILKK